MVIERLRTRDLESTLVADIALGEVNVFIDANARGKRNVLAAVAALGVGALEVVDEEALLHPAVRPVPALHIEWVSVAKRAFEKCRA